MKLSELTKELKEGKHVRRGRWVPGVTAATDGAFGFLKISIDGVISMDSFTWYDIFEGDDWEVVREDGNTTYPNYKEDMEKIKGVREISHECSTVSTIAEVVENILEHLNDNIQIRSTEK